MYLTQNLFIIHVLNDGYFRNSWYLIEEYPLVTLRWKTTIKTVFRWFVRCFVICETIMNEMINKLHRYICPLLNEIILFCYLYFYYSFLSYEWVSDSTPLHSTPLNLLAHAVTTWDWATSGTAVHSGTDWRLKYTPIHMFNQDSTPIWSLQDSTPIWSLQVSTF